jgi:hypothetical protein
MLRINLLMTIAYSSQEMRLAASEIEQREYVIVLAINPASPPTLFHGCDIQHHDHLRLANRTKHGKAALGILREDQV